MWQSTSPEVFQVPEIGFQNKLCLYFGDSSGTIFNEMNNCSQQLLSIPGQSIQKEGSLQRRWYGFQSIGGRERGSIDDDSFDLGRPLGERQPLLQVT